MRGTLSAFHHESTRSLTCANGLLEVLSRCQQRECTWELGRPCCHHRWTRNADRGKLTFMAAFLFCQARLQHVSTAHGVTSMLPFNWPLTARRRFWCCRRMRWSATGQIARHETQWNVQRAAARSTSDAVMSACSSASENWLAPSSGTKATAMRGRWVKGNVRQASRSAFMVTKCQRRRMQLRYVDGKGHEHSTYRRGDREEGGSGGSGARHFY